MNPDSCCTGCTASRHDHFPENIDQRSQDEDPCGSSLFDEFHWDIVHDDLLDASWPFWPHEETHILIDDERTTGGSFNPTQTSHSIATDATISAQLESMFYPDYLGGSTSASPISFETGAAQPTAHIVRTAADRCGKKDLGDERTPHDLTSPAPMFSRSPDDPHQESYFDDFDEQDNVALAQPASPTSAWGRSLIAVDAGPASGMLKSSVRSFATATTVYAQQRLCINSADGDAAPSDPPGGLMHVYNTRKRKFQTSFSEETDDSEEGRPRRATNAARSDSAKQERCGPGDASARGCVELAVQPSHGDLEVLGALQAMWSSITDPVGKVGPRRPLTCAPHSPLTPALQYMRKRDLTPSLAVQLNLHRLLLTAPKKRRQSYGPRSNRAAATTGDDEGHDDLDAADPADAPAKREETTRARNREHARATRRRRRIFKEIDALLAKRLPVPVFYTPTPR